MGGTDTNLPAGWYHRSGDPDGTVRYWDGTRWQGRPVEPPPAEEGKRRHAVGAELLLEFVGRPEIVETSSGLKIEITVLNRGPVDAAVSFEVKTKGAGSIEVLNPQAVISSDAGPLTFQLDVPLHSGISTNTKLSVIAVDKAGTAVAASLTSGGIVGGSVGAVLLSGVVTLGMGWGVYEVVTRPEPPPPPPPPPPTEPIVEDEDDEETALVDDEGADEPDEPGVEEESPVEEESAVGPSPEPSAASMLAGPRSLVGIESNSAVLVPGDFGMVVDLVLRSDANCTDCRYEADFLWDGAALSLGEITAGAAIGSQTLTASVPEGPIVLACVDERDGTTVGEYQQVGDSSLELLATYVDGVIDLDARATQVFDLVSGEPSERCPDPVEVQMTFSTDGVSVFDITSEPPPPPDEPTPLPPTGFDVLAEVDVDCNDGSQSCSNELAFQVVDAGTGEAQQVVLAAGSRHCAPIEYTVLVDGVVRGSTGRVDPGGRAVIDLGASGSPIGDTPAEVVIRATGIEGGCNSGQIGSWAAAIVLDGLLATESAPAIRAVN